MKRGVDKLAGFEFATLVINAFTFSTKAFLFKHFLNTIGSLLLPERWEFIPVCKHRNSLGCEYPNSPANGQSRSIDPAFQHPTGPSFLFHLMFVSDRNEPKQQTVPQLTPLLHTILQTLEHPLNAQWLNVKHVFPNGVPQNPNS